MAAKRGKPKVSAVVEPPPQQDITKSEAFLKNYATMKRALHQIIDQVDMDKPYSDREIRMGNIARLTLVEVKEREA